MMENILAAIVCVVLVFGGFAGWLIKMYLAGREKCIHRRKSKKINMACAKQKEGYKKWRHINSY